MVAFDVPTPSTLLTLPCPAAVRCIKESRCEQGLIPQGPVNLKSIFLRLWATQTLEPWSLFLSPPFPCAKRTKVSQKCDLVAIVQSRIKLESYPRSHTAGRWWFFCYSLDKLQRQKKKKSKSHSRNFLLNQSFSLILSSYPNSYPPSSLHILSGKRVKFLEVFSLFLG